MQRCGNASLAGSFQNELIQLLQILGEDLTPCLLICKGRFVGRDRKLSDALEVGSVP